MGGPSQILRQYCKETVICFLNNLNSYYVELSEISPAFGNQNDCRIIASIVGCSFVSVDAYAFEETFA